jgi:PhnB protein
MKGINPYLNFPGTTEEAFTHYRAVFGGEFAVLQRFGETPQCSDIPPGDRDKIMHVALPLPDGTILMGTDACESMGQRLRVGNNAYLCIETDSEAEASALFAGLTAGGTVEMAPQKMFWGAFWGSGTDRFGVQWMVNYTYPR